jgi:hypothetical protein
MRATSMRRLIGGAAALLAIGAIVFTTTAPALAAVPLGSATNEAIPGIFFSSGQDVGFRVSFVETDASTLSKLYLVLNTTNVSANTYLKATREGADATKSCVAGLIVTCTFKTVRTGEHVVVTAAFTPTAARVTGDGIFSSSGASIRDTGDNSHGDTWVDPDGAAFSELTDDPDLGGGFSATAGSEVANNQTVTALNRQATKVANLPAGVGATVNDGSTATGDCGPYDCTGAIGVWSDVKVGDGQTFGSPFQIVITYYQGVPKSFVHTWTDASGTHYELIGACPKKNPADSAPCFTWSAKDNQATIYTKHNGGVKGI